MRALLLGLLALLAGCSDGSHSVLLVTLDTTRPDALGAYGQSPSVTPNLDQLAGEGVVYERAFTVAPLTLPAHASMLTGLVPPRHGVRDNGLAALPRSAETLAERASSAGFQTAAFLGSVVLDEGFGLEQGFEHYEAPARRFYGELSMGYAERPAIEVVELASNWLAERDSTRPFFLWVHLWDPHAPYEPSADLLERAGGNPYLGEVAACDVALGKLLATLRAQRVLDSTLIVVVADHGEAFMEHEEYSHGPFVWDTTLRVPLILRHPGGKHGGTRVERVASVADVYPTALAAMGCELGVEELAGIDGVNLYDDEPGRERGAYFESYYGYFNFGWHPLWGWVDGRGKFIQSSRPRYYDLDQDPREERDLSAERESGLEGYRRAIGLVGSTQPLARDAEGVDGELRRALQAVGYGALSAEGSEVPAPLAALQLPDGLARTAELIQFQKAQARIAGGKLEEAESLLRSIVESNPGNRFAWDRLALCLIRMNRHREAIQPLERVLSGAPANADTWTYLGLCRVVSGEEDRALAAFTRALEIDPNHVQALGGVIRLLEGVGLGNEALPLKKRFEAAQARR